MRALVQRVSSAWVTAAREPDGLQEETGRIGVGLVALIGVTHEDTAAHATRLADKLRGLRIFPDEQGAMNRSCEDIAGELLVVSQFTLYADTRRGRRPSFVEAAAPDHAEPLIAELVASLADAGVVVATGRFRAQMQLGLVNDGPVTLLLEV